MAPSFERLRRERGTLGSPGFLKLPKNISGRVKLLAGVAAIALSAEKVASLDQLSRER
jgi:hypothetical protein